MQERTKNQLRALAQSWALAHLKKTYPDDYAAHRAKAREEVGGCLAHSSKDCPSRAGHREAHRKALGTIRYAALAALREEHPDLYREVYQGEVEYLLEQEIGTSGE